VKDYEGRDALAVSIRQKEVIRKAMGRHRESVGGCCWCDGRDIFTFGRALARWDAVGGGHTAVT
jgi:hypothetical protein